MLKDLKFEAVEGVKLAIAKTPDERGETNFYAYLINNKDLALQNVMITSEAFENEDGSGRKTSKLRHFHDLIPPGKSAKIEAVDPSVFSFYNRFWISFYINNQVYDQRLLVLPFKEYELTKIEELDLDGVLAEVQ
ncbi:MAG: hypothetical protein DA405_08845 [Bacteroidetes bacterium]|jgi:hypothetical protein|nr:MAG: hypothetical protein DA405_08845 [Bacteroidota bacterium]